MFQKVMSDDDDVATYSATLKMSSNIRKAIHNEGNEMFVSLSRCRVVERYHVLQFCLVKN